MKRKLTAEEKAASREKCNRNLKKFTSETAAAASRKGRAVKNANYARRKSMREWALAIGGMQSKKNKDMTVDGSVMLRMYNNALGGDVRAAELLLKLRGEMVERHEVVEVPKLIDDIGDK